MNNVDLKFYNDIEEWIGELVIIGVSTNGDEEIFRRIKKNPEIKRVYYYGSEFEYKKIEDSKIIFCGFWNDSYYSKKD